MLNVWMFSVWPDFASLIVLLIRGDRVQPVVITPYPLISSQRRMSSICVDRPTPSVPSITMSFPFISPTSRYCRPVPKNRFLSDIHILLLLEIGHGFVIFQLYSNYLANLLLLPLNRGRAVDDGEVEFTRDFIVFVEDFGLEEFEALAGIIAQAEIHTRFVEFWADSSVQDSS